MVEQLMAGDALEGTLESALEPFLLSNPEASLGEVAEGKGIIEAPWSDRTIELVVSAADGELIESLNSVRLPPRFTALWHKDSGDMEFIWTVARPDNPYLDRRFEFRFEGINYICEFAEASSQLLALAAAARPAGPGDTTNYRNLLSFHFAEELDMGRPSSFWIRGLNWDDTTILELAEHLNFFMSYYDMKSPFIMIHSTETRPRPTTYIPKVFPDVIVGRRLDPNLLLLWDASKTREPFLSFLYLYQILEYAAFYHLDHEATANIKRLLVSPDALWRIDEVVHRVVDAVAELRTDEAAKLVAVVKLCIEPEQLWPAFVLEQDFFCQNHTFEGGFTLEPLLKEGWTVEDFKTGGFPRVAEYYRKLRNALAHARERRMSDVIQPTDRNAQLLEPWIQPLRTIAAHTILFERSGA